MLRIFQLWIQYVRLSLIRNAEFRSQFIVELFSGLIWTAFTFITAGIVFLHTETIAGWTKQDIYLLILTFGFIKEGFNALFYSGLGRLIETVRQGTFDMILTKPVNSILQLLFSRFELHYAMLSLIHGILLVIYIQRIHLPISALGVGVFFLLSGCGLAILFAMHLFLQCWIFWFPNIDNIRFLFHAVTDMGRYPTVIFHSAELLFFTVIPVFYIGNVQTLALIKPGVSIHDIAITVFMAIFLPLCAVNFFTRGTRRYASASS